MNMSNLKDSVTNEEIAPDENFMISIEEQIGGNGIHLNQISIIEPEMRS